MLLTFLLISGSCNPEELVPILFLCFGTWFRLAEVIRDLRNVKVCLLILSFRRSYLTLFARTLDVGEDSRNLYRLLLTGFLWQTLIINWSSLFTLPLSVLFNGIFKLTLEQWMVGLILKPISSSWLSFSATVTKITSSERSDFSSGSSPNFGTRLVSLGPGGWRMSSWPVMLLLLGLNRCSLICSVIFRLLPDLTLFVLASPSWPPCSSWLSCGLSGWHACWLLRLLTLILIGLSCPMEGGGWAQLSWVEVRSGGGRLLEEVMDLVVRQWWFSTRCGLLTSPAVGGEWVEDNWTSLQSAEGTLGMTQSCTTGLADSGQKKGNNYQSKIALLFTFDLWPRRSRWWFSWTRQYFWLFFNGLYFWKLVCSKLKSFLNIFISLTVTWLWTIRTLCFF